MKINSKLPDKVVTQLAKLREEENMHNASIASIDKRVKHLLALKESIAKRVSNNAQLRKNLVADNLDFVGINRQVYDERKLPVFIFTEDHSVQDKVLYLKGEEYAVYNFNYSRLIELLRAKKLKIIYGNT